MVGWLVGWLVDWRSRDVLCSPLFLEVLYSVKSRTGYKTRGASRGTQTYLSYAPGISCYLAFVQAVYSCILLYIEAYSCILLYRGGGQARARERALLLAVGWLVGWLVTSSWPVQSPTLGGSVLGQASHRIEESRRVSGHANLHLLCSSDIMFPCFCPSCIYLHIAVYSCI